MYPDAKILCITTDTIKEKLVTAIMRPSKLLLGSNSKPPPDDKKIPHVRDLFVRAMRSLGVDEKVIEVVGTKFITDRFDPDYRNLFLWLAVSGRYRTIKEREDAFYEIPCGDISDYIKLPFSTILNHATPDLITCFQQCFDEELTDIQKEYITRNFDNYHSKQNQLLINDPDEFYRMIKESGVKKLRELKNTLP